MACQRRCWLYLGCGDPGRRWSGDGPLTTLVANPRPPVLSSGYRPDIDGLRALAIGLVLLYHAFPGYVRAGFIGVDVFFVISGYLITGILLDRRTRGDSVGKYFVDFYQRRIRRIFPALIVVLLAVSIFGWFRLFPTEYRSLMQFVAGGAAFVDNFLLWSQAGYFDQATELKPLMHLWSLAIEEQFYLVWPVLILVIGRLARGKYFPEVFAVLAVCSLLYSILVTPVDPTAAYYSPLSRGWELAVGGLLASLHARGHAALPGRAANIISIAALAIIPIGALFLIDKTQFPGWQALLPVGATAALIWFGRGTFVDRRLLGTAPVVYIGLISFPLYLWHWVLLSFLRIAMPSPPGVLLLAALAASVLLAGATYHFVEKPIRHANLKLASAVLLAAMGIVFAFGVAASAFGWSGVQLTATQKALSQEYDPRPDYRFGDCFLDSVAQTASDFARDCLQPAASGEPTVLLWGDSLTAQLYPGLVARQPELGYSITQRTATSCPPSASDEYSDRGNCDAINSSTRDFVERTRPESVIINGRWSEDATQRQDQIAALVSFLRDNGVQHVVLVGPAPDWAPDLRGILIRQTFPGDVLPERMTPPASTWAGVLDRDADLSRISVDTGAQYLSLVDQLCMGDQCLIRVSRDIPDGLVASDHDHLTAQASVFVLRDFALAP